MSDNKSINWDSKSLGEILTFQRGFDITKENQIAGPYFVFSSSGPNSTHSEFKAEGPGVIIGRKGSLGTVFYSADNFWPHDTTLWVKDFHGNNPRFSYYFLKDRHLENFDCGASNPTLNRNHIHKLIVNFPTLPTQQKIAAILSAYDDLIENNIRRIKILEEMGQAVYREWFVHFRFPGHDGVRMVESEQGLIPDGWEITSVKTILDFSISGGWGSEEYRDSHPNPAYVIRGTNIPEVRYLNIENCPIRFHTNSNIRRRRIIENDIIMEISGGGKNWGVGRSVIVTKHRLKKFDSDVICASFCKLLRINSKIIHAIIFYFFLEDLFNNKGLERFQVQSTGIKNFKFDVFSEKQNILIPEISIQNQFILAISPIYDLIQTLGNENSTLRRTRDLLLPKLISGKLDVSELDIMIPEAMT